MTVLQLRVLEAYTRDVGKGIARIEFAAMQQHAILVGGIVEIAGHSRTVAKALPLYPSDEGKSIIRADGVIRQNAQLAIGDLAALKPIQAAEARRVVVAPVSSAPALLPQYVAEVLNGIPTRVGDSLLLPYMNSRLHLLLVDAEPPGEAHIFSPTTRVEILPSLL